MSSVGRSYSVQSLLSLPFMPPSIAGPFQSRVLVRSSYSQGRRREEWIRGKENKSQYHIINRRDRGRGRIGFLGSMADHPTHNHRTEDSVLYSTYSDTYRTVLRTPYIDQLYLCICTLYVCTVQYSTVQRTSMA